MSELIERLMGLASDGVSPAPNDDPAHRKISVHEFAAACYEVAFGPRTVAQIKAYYNMNPAQEAEFDSLVAKLTGTDAVKHRTIFQFEQVLILAEHRAPFYQTPTELRTRLGL